MNKIYNALYVENVLKIVHLAVCIECIIIWLCREIYFEKLRETKLSSDIKIKIKKE
jgi:hypothetical protein